MQETLEYWESAAVRKKAATVALEQRAFESWQGSGLTVESWHRGLLARGYSASSANLYLRHLKATLEGMRKLGLRQDNPARDVPRFSIIWRHPDFLRDEEVERLMAGAQGVSHRFHLLLSLCLYAGLRRREAANARWDWFDFERRELVVRCSHGFTTKTGRERCIPLNTGLASMLLMQGRVGDYVFAAGGAAADRGYEAGSTLARLRERIAMPRVTFTLLRHTFGSRLVRAGVPLIKVSRWLGHSSTRTTEQYYVGVDGYDTDIELL